MAGLENQVVLITGCSSGIGRSLAIEFARSGHKVMATARIRETLDDLVSDRLRTQALDVTDSDYASVSDHIEARAMASQQGAMSSSEFDSSLSVW